MPVLVCAKWEVDLFILYVALKTSLTKMDGKQNPLTVQMTTYSTADNGTAQSSSGFRIGGINYTQS